MLWPRVLVYIFKPGVVKGEELVTLNSSSEILLLLSQLENNSLLSIVTYQNAEDILIKGAFIDKYESRNSKVLLQ